MAWKLYLLQPLPFCRRTFRRFVFSSNLKCPLPQGYHDVSVLVGARDPFEDSTLYGTSVIPERELDELMGTSKWPAKCPCGYAFQPTDELQDNRMRLFAGAPGGREYTISDRDLPPGACRMGADDNLYVRMPDGEDFSPTLNYGGGEKWSMVGTPPAITVSPSINCVGSYHGWIRAGVLTDDCEGRKFPQFPATA